jgi:hypothetical protein
MPSMSAEGLGKEVEIEDEVDIVAAITVYPET